MSSLSGDNSLDFSSFNSSFISLKLSFVMYFYFISLANVFYSYSKSYLFITILSIFPYFAYLFPFSKEGSSFSSSNNIICCKIFLDINKNVIFTRKFKLYR